MASSVHPYQGYQDNGANNQPPPGYSNQGPAYGGYVAGYGGANGVGGNPGAPGNAGYPPYGAPSPNNGYAYGAPPPNVGYAYGASGNTGYTMGTPGIGYSMDALGNIDVPMSAPGNLSYGYGAPTPAGYIGGGTPPGYLVHAPPPGTGGYPYGAVPPGAAYPVACYPVGSGVPGGYMGFGGGQPPPQKPVDPRNQIQTGRWVAGLFSCCDDCVPNFCVPWCCPCVSLAQIYARMGIMQYKFALGRLFLLYVVGFAGNFFPRSSSSSSSDGLYYNNGSYYSTGASNTRATASTMTSLIVTMIVLAGQMIFRAHIWHVRSKVRQRFQIPGSVCGDCCASCCCSCCAIAQLATHVKSYTPGSCSFGGPDVLPAYLH